MFELHTDDIVVESSMGLERPVHSLWIGADAIATAHGQEFGIDILTDDTKQIVHHKVAAKVHLVLNAEDAIASHRFVTRALHRGELLRR